MRLPAFNWRERSINSGVPPKFFGVGKSGECSSHFQRSWLGEAQMVARKNSIDKQAVEIGLIGHLPDAPAILRPSSGRSFM